MSEPFANAPDVTPEFNRQQRDEPKELNFDPPEKVYDKNVVMQPTPSGPIPVEVKRELDPAAQRAISQAQQKEPGMVKEFQKQQSPPPCEDEHAQRIIDRFNHVREHNKGPRR